MARKLTITCDRCEKEIVDQGQVWIVSVLFGPSNASPSAHRARHTAEWCRVCAVETGLLPQYNPEDKKIEPINPKPTLEDLVRELAREEIEKE